MTSRYQRQIILPGFGEITQQKLAGSRILVIGAGGLGCPVLQSLTVAGIGCLGIVDFDTVSLTNLHRQVLFSEADNGRKKVKAAKEKLMLLNSELMCNIYDFAIEAANAFELIQNYDIVVDCTDVLETKYLVNDVCALLKKPLVYASIYQFEGQVSVFHYEKETRNLRDLFAEIPRHKSVVNCGESGVLGVLTGIIGNFQANEVIKTIMESGEILSGKILIYNSLNNEFQTLSFPARPGIFRARDSQEIFRKNYGLNCGNIEQIDSLESLKKVLENPQSVIVDVRNEDETPKVRDFRVKEIPLQNLERNLNELEQNEHLIFLCQSGIRSIQAIEMLRSKTSGKKLYNIRKGISLFQNEQRD